MKLVDPIQLESGLAASLPLLSGAIAALGTARFGGALARLLQDAGRYATTVVAAFHATGRPTRLFSNLSNVDEDLTARPYFDNSYLLDPWYNMALNGIGDGVYRLSEHRPDDFYETVYYQDYYSKTQLVDECAVFVRLAEDVCIVAMLGIREGDLGAKQGDLDGLRLLLPCITELVRKNWGELSTQATTQGENLAALCEARGLCGREAEVTSFLLRGFSNKLIARELGISPETVKVYRKRINRKLGTNSAREVFALFFGEVYR
jgi:DNA-binding CsgD family transcriptional regulator